jgi:cell wall-associated NlpC family hydrolase
MDRTPFLHAIMWTAYEEAMAGSHYLLGADGGHPQANGGPADGLKQRKIELLNVNKNDSIAIETAKYGGRLCHGRMNWVGGYELQLPKKEDLHKCLDLFCPESTWSSGLTPRSKDWTTVIVAEKCKDKRHFDCIFFVNWVITKALMKSKRVTYSINQWTTVGPAKVFKKNDLKVSDLEDGDIFINLDSTPQHIGFFFIGGTRVHASGANRGVIHSEYSESYSHVARLKDSYLKWG